MGENTKIEWTDHTFNGWVGCQKVSPGWDNCYAETLMDKRYHKVEWGPHGERKRTSEANWKLPLRWNKAAKVAGTRPRVFCSSLADVFDNQVDQSWRIDLFDLIGDTEHLDWLLLTKRPENIFDMVVAAGGLPPNVALGTTVEDQRRADLNVPAILEAKAALSPLFVFLSCEPLLGPVDLDAIQFTFRPGYFGGGLGWHHRPYCDEDLKYPVVDWVICGGESGAHARPMHPDWARNLRDACACAGVPFFMKQMTKKAPIPADLMIREFPHAYA